MSGVSKRKPVALPIKIGVGLTLGLIFLMAYLGSIYRCALLQSGVLECRYNVEWLLDSPPNEIGDTIAGVFATLAFVWIVVTVFLQSAELAEQREELALTRQELSLSRQAQEKQVEAAQIQAEIFKDEKLARDQARYFSEIEALTNEIMRQARSEQVISANWNVEKPKPTTGSFSEWYSFNSFTDYKSTSRVDTLANRLATNIADSQERIEKYLREGWSIKAAPNLADFLNNTRKMIERIEALSEHLSAADAVRTQSFGLNTLLTAIENVEDHPDYWRIWGNGKQA